MKNRAASLAAADEAEVTVAVTAGVTSVLSAAGRLTTEVGQTTRFVTTAKPTSTASVPFLGSTSSAPAAAASSAAPLYDYSAGELFGASTDRANCFPYGSPSTLSLSSAPSLTRQQWWCQPSNLYGFLGFSYALESADCSDSTNSYASISRDFARMRADFGATMVRVYAPECREASIWQNLVRAAVVNEMGLLPMVWWGFLEDQTLWRDSAAQIVALFTKGAYKDVAPYVVHSVAFGSEPIGDMVDGSAFISDLAAFRKKMNAFGVPVAISEDWDRPGIMNSTSGYALGPTGAKVKANTDLVHAHVQPYYHPTEMIYPMDVGGYLETYLEWLVKYVGQPTMITESMWPSAPTEGHSRGGNALAEAQVGMSDYEDYWGVFTSSCAMFKEKEVGWFMHTYR